MRRKEFMKRILPIIMSMSMIAVDIMPALAANIAAQELQKETVVLDGIEEVEAIGSVEGVSKVIGLEGSTNYHMMSSEDGTVEKMYAQVYYEESEQNQAYEGYVEDEDRDADYMYNLEGSGDEYYDAATGLYKYEIEGKTYYFAYADTWTTEWDKKGNPIAYKCNLEERVQAFSKSLPQQDEDTGLFIIDGKYYKSYGKKYAQDGTTVLSYYVGNYERVYSNDFYLYTAQRPVADEVTGLYKVNKKYYREYWTGNCDNRVYYCYSGAVEAVLKTIPAINPVNNFLLIDGDYYKDCGVTYRNRTGEEVCYSTETYNNYLENLQNNWDTVILSYYLLPANDNIVYPMNLTIPVTLNEWGEVQDEIALKEQIDAAYGRKLAATDSVYSYYEVNGKYYKYRPSYQIVTTNVDTNGDGYKDGYVSLYAENGDEIVFGQKNHMLTWKPVTNKTEVASEGKAIYIGYQVKENNKQYNKRHEYKAENGQRFTTEINYNSMNPYASGEKVTYQVRAVYYTSTEVETKNVDGSKLVKTIHDIVKTGEWSDIYTYDYSVKEVPVVTGLKVTKENKKRYALNWNTVADSTSYTVQYMISTHQINDVAALEKMKETERNKLQASEWRTYTELDKNYTTILAEAVDWSVPIYEADGQSFKEYVDGKYIYFRVRANVNYTGWSNYYNKQNGEYCAAVTSVAPAGTANIPAIKGFAVENNTNGGFRLKWNEVDDDAMIRIYYSTDASVFKNKDYLYELYNARTVNMCLESDGTMGTYETHLSEDAAMKDKMQIAAKKVKEITISGSFNENYISSYELDLKLGKKYYFVAVTYDDSMAQEDRTATVPLNINGVVYGKYVDISKPTKVISTTENLNKPSVSTVSDKTSITLNMQGYRATGFEVYRKNTKGKFEKIATTTSMQYIDEGLEPNTKYIYQVKAYNYDITTKTMVTGKAAVITAETSTNNYITVKAGKSGKKAVKLTWSKVADVKKYEIYRTNTYSSDTNLSKENGEDNWATAQSNAKWEFVKSISKPEITSYTDKNLTAGDSYGYKVVAYFAVGSGTQTVIKTIYDTDYVTLDIEAPRNLKVTLSGTNAKVSWNADKYASKYQIQYKVYAANGKAYSNTWKSATIKKATYTIKGLRSGDSISIRVRAYGDGTWTDYSMVTDEVALMPVKNIKAVTKKVKDANGKKTAAVKVSWKKVSGAAYYKVYRSTSPAIYFNTDTKTYEIPEEAVLIAKASNTDETNNEVYYSDYKGYYGSVVGTSAMDCAQLQTDVTYHYYVVAYAANGEYCSNGCTNFASVVVNATTPKIKKVTAKKGNITVTMGKATGAKQYFIYRSTKKDKDFKLIGSTDKITYIDKTVKKNTKYYYRILVKGTNALQADYVSKASKVSKRVKAK